MMRYKNQCLKELETVKLKMITFDRQLSQNEDRKEIEATWRDMVDSLESAASYVRLENSEYED